MPVVAVVQYHSKTRTLSDPVVMGTKMAQARFSFRTKNMSGCSLMATVLFWHGFDKLVSACLGGGDPKFGMATHFFKTTW